MLSSYIKEITRTYIQGDAREESFYSILEKLLYSFAEKSGKPNLHVTPLPKKTEAGNPDFRVWDGRQKVIGYIEAKSPDVTNLDNIETSEQLKRYLSTFPNVILTNFLEFRLYRNGELIEQVMIGRPAILKKLQTDPPVEKEDEFNELLTKFYSFTFPNIRSARTLAVELAKRTKFLRDEVVDVEIKEGKDSRGKQSIKGFYEAFRTYLIAGLTPDDFADLYSQTITYGLFAARTRSDGDFNRKLAYDRIPHTIGILREVFQFISWGNIPKPMEWIIDDISEVLAVTDVWKLLHYYYHEGKGRDPIIHFYETFLAEYDPKTREKRGVYYTPEPVVSYIVRSIHQILKDKFGKPDGLADPSVTVLDPAAGTLTFLAEAAQVAVDEYVSKYGEGGKDNLIKEHILKNFYAFELMMAPYAVGHLKMSFLLEELGYKLQPDDRFKLYLTNALEMEELEQTDLPGMASLSEESHLAGKVKKDKPILVILGNPPYSGHSANTSKWIQDLLKKGYTNPDGTKDEGYYKVDGQPLGERNPKWLQDDYVKFIRFAQWKIDRSSEGVLGFITNHSYLDNPTFRGMRQSLMNTFNEINILDLHGNSLKKETCPDGSKDENVFDIRQGVAIGLYIKENKSNNDKEIKHSDLWGRREDKYQWLEGNDLCTTKLEQINPNSEFYFFTPRDEKLLGIYSKFLKINQIFTLSNVGIVTSRDNFVIDYSKESLKRKISLFLDTNISDEQVKLAFNLKDTKNWKVSKVRKNLVDSTDWNEKLAPITYRPFDNRWIFYEDSLVERSRRNVMKHLLRENLALVFMRQASISDKYNHALVSNNIVDNRAFYSSKGIMSLAPLYIYSDNNEDSLLSRINTDEKQPNLDSKYYRRICLSLGNSLSPEYILFYIYGVLYSNIYREKYTEFLKLDYPRIPFTKDYKVFNRMAELGEDLVNLHLLKSKELDKPIVKFQGTGDELVDKIKYQSGKVHINKTQYFEGVEPEVYGYQIGGYQVCNKWLKDRKDRRLSLEDIKHYCRVVTALKKTIEVQVKIDKIYPEVEKDVIEFEEF